jgi:hypothetical protein
MAKRENAKQVATTQKLSTENGERGKKKRKEQDNKTGYEAVKKRV